MTTATFSRGCHQFAMDILADEGEIPIECVEELAADLELFIGDWRETKKFMLKIAEARRITSQPIDMNALAHRICGVPEGELKAVEHE